MKSIMLINFGYSIVGLMIALIGAVISYKLLDKLTTFNTSEQLKEGNVAIGLTVMGMFIAIGLIVGLIFGISLM